MNCDMCSLVLGAVGELGRDTDESVLFSGDIKRMTSEEQIFRGSDDTHISE